MQSVTNFSSCGPLFARLWQMAWRSLLLGMLLVFGSAAAQAQTYQLTNTTDSATGGISDTLTPCTARFTRTFSVSSSITVSDVNVGVLMAHTKRSDLTIYLVSPSGTRIQMMTGDGGKSDNVNVLFDDEASSGVSNYTNSSTATATTSVPPYSSTYRPTSALSGFDGQNALGTWTLEICDSVASNAGTFYQADLYINQYADLSLTKSVSNTNPSSGASISYTLTARNAASPSVTATGVIVKDLLPTGVTFVSASGTGVYDSGTGNWTVGSLAPGASASITITITVSATSGAVVTNRAEITTSSVSDSDSTPNNGSTTEDDYASVSFTVSNLRLAGTPPNLICPTGTTLFDWDTISWTAGSTSGTYSVTGIGSVSLAITNPGVFLSNATYGGQSPTRQNVVTGGLAPAQFSLMQLVKMANVSDSVTTTITLPTAVPGAQLTIFDVDYFGGQFADRVTVTGSYKGSSVTPTLTNGVMNYVIGNTAYGDDTSGDTEGNGNVVVTFTSPVDTIVISYGNHSLAPSDPGQQAITIHDITYCKPQATVTVSKTSSVISDPTNGTTIPKAIPGAVIEYCILVSNAGSATLSAVVATDTLPSGITYTAGTLKTGTSCALATTAEDDDNSGADESDPNGASASGITVIATGTSVAPAAGFALSFRATVN